MLKMMLLYLNLLNFVRAQPLRLLGCVLIMPFCLGKCLFSALYDLLQIYVLRLVLWILAFQLVHNYSTQLVNEFSLVSHRRLLALKRRPNSVQVFA